MTTILIFLIAYFTPLSSDNNAFHQQYESKGIDNWKTHAKITSTNDITKFNALHLNVYQQEISEDVNKFKKAYTDFSLLGKVLSLKNKHC